jgi:catalase
MKNILSVFDKDSNANLESTPENILKELQIEQQEINSKEKVPPFIPKGHHKEKDLVNFPSDTVETFPHGVPMDDHERSLTVGEYGPVLLQDLNLFEKNAQFNRERIPERVVHAKGAGAHGYFVVTDDITKYCKAKIFSAVGKKTNLFVRFSQVVGEKGSPDTEREVRGFAIKFYTEEGIWDMVGNDLPVFFVRDGIKFPDFIHSEKKNPNSNLFDPDMAWDFISLHPESVHALTMLYSDRGTPASYRNIHSFGNHTFKFVNDKDEVHYVKIHVKAQEGFKTLTLEESKRIKSEDADYLVRDLHNHLNSGKEVKYDLCVQIMPVDEAPKYKFNVLDVTKVWYHKDYPLHKIGEIVLNRNPTNFFAETEQVAFCPANLVPGIEPTNDKLLQARLIAYNDTQRHRLGTKNFKQLPINCPFASGFANQFDRDGFFLYDSQGTGFPNYFPNSFGGPRADSKYKLHTFSVEGRVDRFDFTHPNDDFEQANALYSTVMDEKQRSNLIKNITDNLKDAKRFIQERQCKIFFKVNPDFGMRVAERLGLKDLLNEFRKEGKDSMKTSSEMMKDRKEATVGESRA